MHSGCHLPALQFAAQQFIEKGNKDETLSGFDQDNRWPRLHMTEGQCRGQSGESTTDHHNRRKLIAGRGCQGSYETCFEP